MSRAALAALALIAADALAATGYRRTQIPERDVCLTVERQEMMLAHRVERDLAQDHHLVVPLFEADGEHFARVLVQTREDLLIHARDASGRVAQALT